MYYASLSKQAEKFIKKAEKELAKRLIDKIEKLETEPVPQDAKTIEGSNKTFRVRIGKYRILYTINHEQKEILKYLAGAEKLISQKEIVKIFNKTKSNVSFYYFKPLKDNNIIEQKNIDERTPYYGLTADYIPLKWLMNSQREVNKSIDDKSKQLPLL